jgi:hypothetical protein
MDLVVGGEFLEESKITDPRANGHRDPRFQPVVRNDAISKPWMLNVKLLDHLADRAPGNLQLLATSDQWPKRRGDKHLWHACVARLSMATTTCREADEVCVQWRLDPDDR